MSAIFRHHFQRAVPESYLTDSRSRLNPEILARVIFVDMACISARFHGFINVYLMCALYLAQPL